MSGAPIALGAAIAWCAAALIGASVYPAADWEFVLGVALAAALIGATCAAIVWRTWRP